MAAGALTAHPPEVSRGQLRLALCGPLGGEYGGGTHPERGVRSSKVVVLAPVADHHPRLGQAGELLDIEQLVTDAGVKLSTNGSARASQAR